MDPIAELEEVSSDLDEYEDKDERLNLIQESGTKEAMCAFGKPIAIPENIENLTEEEKKKEFALLEEEEYYEVISRIALRSGRLVTTRQLKELAESRAYISLDSINSKTDSNHYTVGIVCSRSPVKLSKVKTCFIQLMLTSLKKTAPKNTYKTLPVFVYGGVAREFERVEMGSVFAVIGPLVMPKSVEYDLALKVSQRPQLVKIGRSLDFDYCEHIDRHTESRCSNFVNATIEHRCELHAHKRVIDISKPEERQKENEIIEDPIKSFKNSTVKGGSEFDKLASFIKKRNENKDHSNQIYERLKEREKKVEVELEAVPSEADDDFIKSLMKKKKSNFFAQRFKGSSKDPKKFKEEP